MENAWGAKSKFFTSGKMLQLLNFLVWRKNLDYGNTLITCRSI